MTVNKFYTILYKAFDQSKMVFSNLFFSPELSHISLKMLPSCCQSSFGVPNSAALPSLSTKIRSKSTIVLRRCAMTISVLPVNSSRMLRWIRLSVVMSTADVASSSTMILGLETIARARQRSWRCPWERLPPDSETGDDSERKMLAFCGVTVEAAAEEGSAGVGFDESMRWTRASDSRSSVSVRSLNGSRLLRMVPENRTGS